MVTALEDDHMYFIRILSSRTSNKHVDRGYATCRHEFEGNAKPWSELFEPKGPGLKSSLFPAPTGETKRRSLDQIVNSTINQDRKDKDSSTPLADHPLIEETTTFSLAAIRYINDMFLLTQQS